MVIGGGRLLELGVPKIYVGSSKCSKHTYNSNSRRVWGHAPPRKILKIRYQEIQFGGMFGRFSCQ